jgi:rhodanese-related sulfurtransferase
VRLSFVGQAVALALFAFLPAIGQAIYFRDRMSWQAPVPASGSVSVAEARAWGDNAIWIDARADEEFARDHVPGAISLNEDRWHELLPELLAVWSPEKKIVVYCSNENCNRALEVVLRLRKEMQFKNVFVLKDGWEGWIAATRK